MNTQISGTVSVEDYGTTPEEVKEEILKHYKSLGHFLDENGGLDRKLVISNQKGVEIVLFPNDPQIVYPEDIKS